jgi:arylsulfatase A-like enzyme
MPAGCQTDPQGPGKKAVYTIVNRARMGLGRAVRTEDYTFVQWPDGSAQLYDHRVDFKEYVNLVKDTSGVAKEAMEKMKQLLAAGPKPAAN